MSRPEFRERPSEFKRDLSDALRCAGVQGIQGKLQSAWGGKEKRGHVSLQLKTLNALPDAERFMFALRTYCLISNCAIVQQIVKLKKCVVSRPMAEMLATAIGYSPPDDGISPLESLPLDRDVLVEDARLLSDRMASGYGHSPERAENIADGLQGVAVHYGYELQTEVHRKLEVMRAAFNVDLMQSLVWSGVTPEFMRRQTQHGHPSEFFDKHQVNRETHTSPLHRMNTVHSLLGYVNPPEKSTQLASDYFSLYEPFRGVNNHTAQLVINRRVFDLNGIAAEAGDDDINERSATVHMVAHACGVHNSDDYSKLLQQRSPERRALRAFLRRYGSKRNSKDVARALVIAKETIHTSSRVNELIT